MLLSLVIPVYQEEAALPHLLAKLKAALDPLDMHLEIIFVNDGSQDKTGDLLLAAAKADPRIRVIEFSRNFGHQVAVTAGLDLASGDAVVVMDADLQDPPELLPKLVEYYLTGYDVVSPQRLQRDGDSWFKRVSAAGFYWIMNLGVDSRLRDQVGDFRLYSRRAVLAMRGLREQHRFLRGMVAWLGLKEKLVPFERRARVAGDTKYPLVKMLRFAWTAVTSTSAAPLRLTSLLGLTLSFFGAAYLLDVVFFKIATTSTVPGWTSLVSLQVLFSGTILFAIGLVGDYLARVYEEAKSRPLYVVSRCYNVDPAMTADRAFWLPPHPAVSQTTPTLPIQEENKP